MAKAGPRDATGIGGRPGPAANRAGIAATLQAGLRHHQSGDLAQADTLYRDVLARDPQNADALHLLGVVRSERRQYDEAIALIGRALERNPRAAPAHNNLANALAALGRHEEAAASYRKALALRPEFTEAHNNLGNALNALSRHEEAIASLHQALVLRPGYAEAQHNLGNALRGLHRYDEAIASYQRALALKPDYPDTWNNLGTALGALGRHEEAVASLQRALALRPDYAEACNNLGSELTALKRYEDALASHRKALSIRSDFAEAHNNLGNALHGLHRYEEAVACYYRALALRASYAQAHSNLGIVLHELGRNDEALASFERALAIQPDNAYAHWNRAFVRLAHGDFRGGWADYEWRNVGRPGADYLADRRAPGRILPRPSTLLPLDLQGKRLLLLPDQGLGDELFFLRFASRARARGAWLAYLASPRIASLVERSGAVDRVVATAAQAGEVDHVFSVGDLPLVVGAGEGEPLPPPLALTPLPECLAAAHARLRALGPGPCLAVTWRAGTPPTEQQQRRRSLFKEVAIEALAGALAGWSGEIVAVQRRPQPGEVARLAELLGRPVHDASTSNEDLEEMLALLAAVDDYVAVSNTNVHLIAGLGRPARVIVPDPPEWRWMDDGEASPWFPGIRVYRQARGQPMEQAFASLGPDLRAECGAWLQRRTERNDE